ncbi:aspartate/glutamate racemase family protein [Motiliproteus sp.]|uniref:aspartate/glutamate racemase family protein n=1 Tax=Motiliproteus sp. TaxID=1898955 RepID=UPI003BAD9F6C
MSTVIGILGGMGPLATVDFVEKVIGLTPARCDQEHLPLIIHSVPQIPDRTACLIDQQRSPLAAMARGVETLAKSGVGAIVIPCNTAHHWYEPLSKDSPVPILHIADACAESLVNEGVASVGLMATDGTLKAGFYPRKLSEHGIAVTLPGAELQQQVMEGIYRVKAGQIETGGRILESCVEQLLEQGVERVILACTEIPLALDRIESPWREQSVDATRSLASACVRWHQQQTSLLVA